MSLFPSNPSIGDEFLGKVWNGTAWEVVGTNFIGPPGEWDSAQTISNKTINYTLVTSDAGDLITVDAATDVDITVDDSLDLDIGQRIDILRLGTGEVTIVASSTTVSATPGLKLRDQHSAATLVCVAADSYVLLGDLKA